MINNVATLSRVPFDDMPNDFDALESANPLKSVHPFELAGLGHAPFYCVRCTDSGEYGASHCRYCGHDIRYEFHVKGEGPFIPLSHDSPVGHLGLPHPGALTR